MTQERKNAIVDDIMALLIQLTDEETTQETTRKKPVEMLTIKECTQAVKGLSEHTVRQLVAQNKVKYIRTGQGKRCKIFMIDCQVKCNTIREKIFEAPRRESGN